MTLRRLLSFVFVAFASMALFIACSDDVGLEGALVGGECRDDFDCDERCVRGGDFPGGMCTIRCRDSRDCPRGTWCIDEAGGVCALSCRDDLDCRRGYECDDERLRGDRGREWVCIGD